MDIRPSFVIESIPGLSISGSRRKPEPKIHVEYVNKGSDTTNGSRTQLVGSQNDEHLSITESTTSRFEEVEKLVEQNSFEFDTKKKLREKVKEILIKK